MLLVSNLTARTYPTHKFHGDITEASYGQFMESMRGSYTNVHIIDINSNGGDLLTAFNIIDIMRAAQESGHIFICTVSKAYSAAFTILSACDYRLGRRKSRYMDHRCYKPYFIWIMYTWFTGQMDSIRLGLLENRITIPMFMYVEQYMMKEKFYGPDEAIRIGIIDGYEYD